jgi:hypothetical protein
MTPLCSVKGCTHPAFVDRRGRVYKKCIDHHRLSFKESVADRLQAKERRPAELIGQPVCIIVVDWADNLLLRLEGVVKTTEPMPETEADLQQLLALEAQAGTYVAKPHAWKECDLNESA